MGDVNKIHYQHLNLSNSTDLVLTLVNIMLNMREEYSLYKNYCYHWNQIRDDDDDDNNNFFFFM